MTVHAQPDRPVSSLARRIVARIVSVLSTAVVLGAFAGIWFWGHKTHWTFPGSEHSSGVSDSQSIPSAKPEAETGSVDPAILRPIRFNTAAEIREAGIEVELSRRAPVEELVVATAEVGYNQARLAQLAPRAPGYVYAIRTRLGQPVAEGEVLALVDSEAVGRAKADYLRELFLTRYKGEVLERYRAIGAAVVPERSILEAEMELKEAELRQFTAQQRLINLGLEPPEPDAKTPTTPQEFARQIQFLGLPDAVATKLQPRPKTSNLIPLLAPFDGVVTRQDVVAGEVVSPDRPAFAVANLSTVWLNLAVRKEDAGRIRVGQTVRFSAAGLPGPVSGTLDWIVPEADEKTRTVRARCTLANPVIDGGERLLRINLFGSAEIVLARREAIVIPDTAIQRLADGVPVVFVRSPDGLTFAPRPIRLGPSRGGLTEILDGLTPGISVVTSGSYVLKSELMKDSLTAN